MNLLVVSLGQGVVVELLKTFTDLDNVEASGGNFLLGARHSVGRSFATNETVGLLDALASEPSPETSLDLDDCPLLRIRHSFEEVGVDAVGCRLIDKLRAVLACCATSSH